MGSRLRQEPAASQMLLLDVPWTSTRMLEQHRTVMQRRQPYLGFPKPLNPKP